MEEVSGPPEPELRVRPSPDRGSSPHPAVTRFCYYSSAHLSLFTPACHNKSTVTDCSLAVSFVG